MIPQHTEAVRQVAPAALQQNDTIAYLQILAYYRGELSDPRACSAVEDQLLRDPRWQAHVESIRHLDLERAAAIQDAADLARFKTAQATPSCRAVAETRGEILEAMLHENETANKDQRRAWTQHADQCVYCRRMRRLAHARQQQREAGLPVQELLLRDWLLQPCYLQALRDATRRLGFEWQLDTPDSGDTLLQLDTIVRNPPPPASQS
jgi:hypothetical protein